MKLIAIQNYVSMMASAIISLITRNIFAPVKDWQRARTALFLK
jgi:hypothetical protein